MNKRIRLMGGGDQGTLKKEESGEKEK